MKSKIYSPKQFGEMIGRTVRTLQKWDVTGKLKAHRNFKNRRYYTHEQYLAYRGMDDIKEKKNIVYARVSSAAQKKDLAAQINALELYCAARGYQIAEWVKEIGSGLDYKRKRFSLLLEQIEKGLIEKVIIAHQDRLVRFGFDWFSEFARAHGAEVEVMNQPSLSPEEELTQDLLSIIHCFSSRLYGLRRYKKVIRKMVEENDTSEQLSEKA